MVESVKAGLQGMVVGVANIIPGVSGGTLALIMGIYERLIAALHSIDLAFVRSGLAFLSFRKGAAAAFGKELKRIDAPFLGCIAAGALVAIAATAKGMAFLLANYHAPSYAFFFGLVLLSMGFPYRYIKRHSWRELVSLLVAAAVTVSLSLLVSDDEQIAKETRKQEIAAEEEAAKTAEVAASPAADEGSATAGSAFISLEHPGGKRLAFLFMAAALAISAMVLPGVSGSFVLLLMGGYFDILMAVNTRAVIVLGVFALGALAGLLLFSRVMHLLLTKVHDVTMAFMIGLMIGSLWVLWPFKRIAVVGTETLYLSNLWPSVFGKSEMISILAAVAGGALVSVFYRLDKAEPASGATD